MLLLARVHNKRLAEDALVVWCRALAPYARGKELWRALEQSCEEKAMPGIQQVKLKLAGRPELEEFKSIPALTPVERKRADQAAIMSMLWLHYEYAWPLKSFAGHILGRMLGADPTKALELAKQTNSRDEVWKWMSDQARAEPIPCDKDSGHRLDRATGWQR